MTEKQENPETRKVLYDASFKLFSGIVGMLLTVLWWVATHQLSSLEEEIKDLKGVTELIRNGQNQAYGLQLQARIQLDTNTKRIDKLENSLELAQEKMTRLETLNGFKQK